MSTELATRSVPFFNYRGVFAPQESEFLGIVQDVIRRGAFIMQQDLRTFEQNLARFTGAKHAFGVANGTDALIIALRAAGIGPGDEVIFPSHTMVASPASIHFAGATPVPVECGPDHMIDPESVRQAVTSKTRAIMPVQLNGRTANMDALQSIADEHGLLIVEDAAQALGSRYKGRCAGTFGIAGTYSFYPAKVLGCFGDGGGIVTNDDEVASRIHQLRDHGRDEEGEVVTWGLNSRLDNLQAAILDFQLKDYDKVMARRRELAGMYQEELGGLSELALPPAPDSDPDHYDVYQNYELEADRRDELKDFLKEAGVGTLVQWGGKAVHQFKGLGFNVSLPKTDRFFERCLMIPLNMTMTDEDLLYVCSQIKRFYGR